MNIKILFFGFIFITSCEVYKVPLNQLNKLEPVVIYETTEDYINKKPMNVEAGILIATKSHQHVDLKGIFNINTGQKINKASSAWAIEYKNDIYFNLGYSNDLNHWETFIKFDIIGKYCISIIDDNSPNILKSTSSSAYGGGLTGVLIAESNKWGKNWKDKDGNKKKILLINTQEILKKSLRRNASSLGNYMTKKQFEIIIDEAKVLVTDENVKKIEFEKVLEIIKIANNNAKTQ